VKRCSYCEVEKPASEFYRDRRRTDGLCSWCKACMKAADKEREERRRLNAVRAAAEGARGVHGSKRARRRTTSVLHVGMSVQTPAALSFRDGMLIAQADAALECVDLVQNAGDILAKHKAARAPWDQAWLCALRAVEGDPESVVALLEAEPLHFAAYHDFPTPKRPFNQRVTEELAREALERLAGMAGREAFVCQHR
jgi:hypothetical protein